MMVENSDLALFTYQINGDLHFKYGGISCEEATYSATREITDITYPIFICTQCFYLSFETKHAKVKLCIYWKMGTLWYISD